MTINNLREIKFTDIDGIMVGNAEDIGAGTGCTIVACKKGAVAGVDVRGGSPATRETDLLKSENNVDIINGVILSGGSAFGLDAASGAMKYFEENGIGFDVGMTKVPIVCGASLFDLDVGDYRVRPDKAMGYRACEDMNNIACPSGNIGAGIGATVGKFFGPRRAMKGGLGSYALEIGDLKVGAIVAVNCLGDVIDPNTNEILAGLLDESGENIVGTESELIHMYKEDMNVFNGNTTIGVVATNGKFEKREMNKLASMSHNGYGRAIRPAHTMFDGDTIFSMATGMVEADVNVVGMLATMAMERAVVDAIKSTEESYGYKSYREIFKK